ncbi:MAG: hypothetical protein F6J93_17630 [Oscillatoria sp. SIO1A7]|nr:hypothetical protein [Oscillatoria sp. SIO1A7]
MLFVLPVGRASEKSHRSGQAGRPSYELGNLFLGAMGGARGLAVPHPSDRLRSIREARSPLAIEVLQNLHKVQKIQKTSAFEVEIL